MPCMIRRPFVFIYIFMYKVFSIITQFIPVVNVFPAAARCHGGQDAGGLCDGVKKLPDRKLGSCRALNVCQYDSFPRQSSFAARCHGGQDAGGLCDGVKRLPDRKLGSCRALNVSQYDSFPRQSGSATRWHAGAAAGLSQRVPATVRIITRQTAVLPSVPGGSAISSLRIAKFYLKKTNKWCTIYMYVNFLANLFPKGTIFHEAE